MNDAIASRFKMPASGDTLDLGDGYTITNGPGPRYGRYVIRHKGAYVGSAQHFSGVATEIDKYKDEVIRPTAPVAPVESPNLATAIRARALACREEQTPLGDLLAEAIDRLAYKAAWVDALDPADVYDRADDRAADAQAEEVTRAYKAGYREGRLGTPSRPF